MTAEKTTKQVEFEFEGKMCKGYEIHQGQTRMGPLPPPSPVGREPESERQSTNSRPLTPVTLQDNCIGTYIHGFLDNPSVIEYILKPFGQKSPYKGDLEGLEEFKDRQYDLLADHVRKYVDIEKLYKIIKEAPQPPKGEHSI